MKIRVPDYYKNFKCISSKCEDTCCAGWEIVIDDETYKYYNTVSGEFGERLKCEIISDDDENIFMLKGENCSFLNKNKMCDIYIELGEEKLCDTCKQYPRFIEEYEGIREIGISLSCPEAARIILNDSKQVEFELEENDEIVSRYNDINYEMFNQLINSREIAIKILQDRSIDLNKRIALVLNFAQDIQDMVDQNKLSKISEIRNKYLDNKFIEKFIVDLNQYKNNKIAKYDSMFNLLKIYQNLDHINESWPKVLKHTIEYFHGTKISSEFYVDKYEEFDTYYVNKMYEYENLMVYFIFRYFMKSVYDYDVIAKVKLTVISYLIIKELDVVRWCDNGYKFNKDDQIDIMHMYSKDVEHSEENLDELAEIFEINKMFNLNNLMTMLMN